MLGAISNIDAVGRWFKNNESPYYTLSYYSTQSPTGQGTVIGRNIKESDVETAWERLKTTILDQTGFGRAQLHLIVYDKPAGANTPTGRTNIDITANSSQSGAVAAIGSLPNNYIDENKVQSIISERERVWKLEQENERLKEQLDGPSGEFWDKVIDGIDRIGSTPLGMALVSKILGSPMPAMLPQIGGHNPDNSNLGSDSDDVDHELDNLEMIAKAHGLTLKQLLARTAALAQDQPAIVAMLAKNG